MTRYYARFKGLVKINGHDPYFQVLTISQGIREDIPTRLQSVAELGIETKHSVSQVS